MTAIEQNTMTSIQTLNKKMPDFRTLELRDLFAMHAINALINKVYSSESEFDYSATAKEAYDIADAMLRARSK